MTALTPIDAKSLTRRLKSRELTLIDIREPDEFAREHIDGVVSLPLSRLEAGHVALRGVTPVAFTCKTGMRTNSNCDRLVAHVGEPAYVLDGGLDGWRKAGLATNADRKAQLEIMRQVLITVLFSPPPSNIAVEQAGLLIDQLMPWIIGFWRCK